MDAAVAAAHKATTSSNTSNNLMMDDNSQDDICRVCRCEAQQDRPLFYPCICTGSIKYIHQDCLMQWMRYSHKEYCELCGHRFSFQPIYAPDMPRVLPLRDVVIGLMSAVLKGAKSWLHYTLVGIAWFGIVPLSAYRTYRYLFRASSFDMILSLPFDIFSTENLTADAFRGCFVVTCTLLSFVGLVWLREQILHGGGPDWLERDDQPLAAAPVRRAIINRPARARDRAAADADRQPQENADAAAAAAVADPPAAAAVPDPPAAADVPDQPAAAAVLDDPNDDNNNAEAPHANVPMNNAAPAVPNPADNEGEAPLAQEPGAAPAAANDAGVAGAGAVVAENENEEPNWNPMEWDRAAEELTWERLLGLDGSLVFLEHVFWIISLNTMFIFTFAFCPYCVGNFVLNALDILHPDKPLLHFHGLLMTLFGYCCIGISLVIMHFFARVFRLRRMRWLIGLCYIVVKVSLLSVVEIGVLPLICGWWLDICSLPLFDASIKDRKQSFKAAPGTSLFIHWMFGMIYVYYFAAFISLLREVLRPGVLWIFRNVSDPDFSPIQEMIHVPILRHARRLIASAMIFGFSVLLMLWLPIKMLKSGLPTFLPYVLSGDSEVNDLSLQLMLLQIVLPGFFEQSHTRAWLKAFLRVWCVGVAWLLGIRSYLLGNDDAQADGVGGDAPGHRRRRAGAAPAVAAAAPPAPPANPGEPMAPLNLGAAHQAIMQRLVHEGFQLYDRPTFFPVRLCGLLFIMCISIVVASVLTMTVPVWIGRRVLIFWARNAHSANSLSAHLHAMSNRTTLSIPTFGTPNGIRPHELYTAELGTYICWLILRAVSVAFNILPQGRTAVVKKVKNWFQVATSYALPLFIFILLLGVIPLLFGLLLELVLVVPIRVSLRKTPLHLLWQDWALGVLYTKIAVAITLMGPDWSLKRAIERCYRDGLRDIDLKFVINDLAIPVIEAFGLALAIPYILAHSILPMFVKDAQTLHYSARLMYPFCFVLISTGAYIIFEIKQFKKLYISIKVDKYLVGQRLVNYEHRKRQQEAKEKAAAEATKASNAASAAKEPSGEADAEGEAEAKVGDATNNGGANGTGGEGISSVGEAEKKVKGASKNDLEVPMAATEPVVGPPEHNAPPFNEIEMAATTHLRRRLAEELL